VFLRFELDGNVGSVYRESTDTDDFCVSACDGRVNRSVCPEPAGEYDEGGGGTFRQRFVNLSRKLRKEYLAL